MKELFIEHLKLIEETSNLDDVKKNAAKAFKKYAEDLQPHADFFQVRGAHRLLVRLDLARQVKTDAGKTWEYGPASKQ